MFQYGQRQQIARAPHVTRNNRISPMPAYRLADQAQGNPNKRVEPPHEINIIQQTVVVNKNSGLAASGTKGNQKPGSGIPKHSRRNAHRNTPRSRSAGRRMGRFRSGNAPGVASLPQGVHILPNIQWLRNGAVQQALRRRNPARSRTRIPQHLMNGGISNGQSQQQNPTEIIIYQNGQKQPIVIRARGHVTLSRSQAVGGKSNLVISKTSETLQKQASETTTTLKPGEDPPEPENEVAVR